MRYYRKTSLFLLIFVVQKNKNNNNKTGTGKGGEGETAEQIAFCSATSEFQFYLIECCVRLVPMNERDGVHVLIHKPSINC